MAFMADSVGHIQGDLTRGVAKNLNITNGLKKCNLNFKQNPGYIACPMKNVLGVLITTLAPRWEMQSFEKGSEPLSALDLKY